MHRRTIKRVILFAVLFLIAVPWYWRPLSLSNQQLFGFPPWFVVAVLGSLLISSLTCWFLRERWQHEQHEAESR